MDVDQTPRLFAFEFGKNERVEKGWKPRGFSEPNAPHQTPLRYLPWCPPTRGARAPLVGSECGVEDLTDVSEGDTTSITGIGSCFRPPPLSPSSRCCVSSRFLTSSTPPHLTFREPKSVHRSASTAAQPGRLVRRKTVLDIVQTGR